MRKDERQRDAAAGGDAPPHQTDRAVGSERGRQQEHAGPDHVADDERDGRPEPDVASGRSHSGRLADG